MDENDIITKIETGDVEIDIIEEPKKRDPRTDHPGRQRPRSRTIREGSRGAGDLQAVLRPRTPFHACRRAEE